MTEVAKKYKGLHENDNVTISGETYKIIKLLGTGAEGDVFKVT